MKKLHLTALLTLFAVAAAPALRAASASTVQSAVQSQAQLNRSAASTQKRINQIADNTQDLLNQYLSIAQQTDQLRAYDDQLQQFIQSQQDQMSSINQQMSQVGVVEQGLLPLMLQMTNSLDQYIKLDVPYHLDERLAAVQQLRDTLNNPSVSVADKFKQVIQAYNDEISSSKTLETYRGELAMNGRTRTVNFLRLGHLVLAYQTLDRSETGYWDKQKQQWQVAGQYTDAVAQGIAIANKQAVPDLLALPVSAPEASQ